jgi:hypothetical protein
LDGLNHFLAELVELDWPKNTNWIGRISLLKFAAGAKSRHAKWNQTESRMRLVGPTCNWDLRPCILRISIR